MRSCERLLRGEPAEDPTRANPRERPQKTHSPQRQSKTQRKPLALCVPFVVSFFSTNGRRYAVKSHRHHNVDRYFRTALGPASFDRGRPMHWACFSSFRSSDTCCVSTTRRKFGHVRGRLRPTKERGAGVQSMEPSLPTRGIRPELGIGRRNSSPLPGAKNRNGRREFSASFATSEIGGCSQQPLRSTRPFCDSVVAESMEH